MEMIGKKFGLLTVLEEDIEHPKTKNRCKFWKCQCDCGNIKVINGNNLRSGNTKSCGCLHKIAMQQRFNDKNNIPKGFEIKNYKNQKIGKLLVLEATNQRTKDGYVIWKCQCDCGNITYINSHNLNRQSVLSCGCLSSKGEQKLISIFQDLKIVFEKEKTFSSCVFPNTNQLARFDFYLPDFNILIEFDGSQHFFETKYLTKDSLQTIQARDQFKDQWCKNNNIILIRIPFWDYDKLNATYIKNKLQII